MIRKKVNNTDKLEFRNKNKVTKCPNYGTSIKAVISAECEYCGSTIVKNASAFVLSIKNIIK